MECMEDAKMASIGNTRETSSDRDWMNGVTIHRHGGSWCRGAVQHFERFAEKKGDGYPKSDASRLTECRNSNSFK